MEMQEMSLRLLRLFGAVCILAFVSACSQKPEDQIVAKWKEVESTDTMEFFKDGSFNFATKKQGSIGGTYKFVDAERVKLEFGGFYAMAGPQIAKVSFSGGELTITMPNGQSSKLTKVK